MCCEPNCRASPAAVQPATTAPRAGFTTGVGAGVETGGSEKVCRTLISEGLRGPLGGCNKFFLGGGTISTGRFWQTAQRVQLIYGPGRCKSQMEIGKMSIRLRVGYSLISEACCLPACDRQGSLA